MVSVKCFLKHPFCWSGNTQLHEGVVTDLVQFIWLGKTGKQLYVLLVISAYIFGGKFVALKLITELMGGINNIPRYPATFLNCAFFQEGLCLESIEPLFTIILYTYFIHSLQGAANICGECDIYSTHIQRNEMQKVAES